MYSLFFFKKKRFFYPFRIKKIIRHATTLISASKVVKIADVAKRTSDQIKLITSKNHTEEADESEEEHGVADANEDDGEEEGEEEENADVGVVGKKKKSKYVFSQKK